MAFQLLISAGSMGEIQSSKCCKSPDASVSTSGGDDPTLAEAVMNLCQRHGGDMAQGQRINFGQVLRRSSELLLVLPVLTSFTKQLDRERGVFVFPAGTARPPADKAGSFPPAPPCPPHLGRTRKPWSGCGSHPPARLDVRARDKLISRAPSSLSH